MIRHCVFIKFKTSISASQIQELYQRLDDLTASLDGALKFNGGKNVTPEVGMDKGFTSGFIIDFKDADARDAYLINATHQEIGADLVAASQSGTDGILVFDLDV